MYSYKYIKDYLSECISSGYEAELMLTINGIDYMIIIYKDYCTFQRCNDDRGEFKYKTLDELYNTVLIDDILLKRDWNKIERFEGLDD